jgi:hypothetical protein
MKSLKLPVQMMIVLTMLGALWMFSRVDSGWAAPNSQGTVPTPRPRATATSPVSPPVPPSASGSSQSAANSNSNPNPSSNAPKPIGCVVGGGGTCVSDRGDLTVKFPNRAVPLGTIAMLTPINANASTINSRVPVNFLSLGHLYELTVLGADNRSVDAFALPVELWIGYDDPDLASARGNPSTLTILRLNAQWLPEQSGLEIVNLDLPAKRMHANITSPGIYGLFTDTLRETTPPPAPATPQADDNNWLRILQRALARLLQQEPSE